MFTFPKKHLRHRDLAFIPHGGGVLIQWGYSTSYALQGVVCLCLWGWIVYNHTPLTNSATIPIFLPPLSPPLPLWLADKKMATATVFPETAIVSWASVEGRLKIISGAIGNGGRQQNIHSSLLLNCYPATLQILIKVMPLASPVSIYTFMLTWLLRTRHNVFFKRANIWTLHSNYWYCNCPIPPSLLLLRLSSFYSAWCSVQ